MQLRSQRVFNFKHFNEAISFAGQVAKIADAADHHPLYGGMGQGDRKLVDACD